jgi:exodeoxyribonuclease-3
MNDNKQQFSWWDYRAGAWQKNLGMRIDHLLLSPEAADLIESSDVFMPLRAKEKASDHTPVWCCLKN